MVFPDEADRHVVDAGWPHRSLNMPPRPNAHGEKPLSRPILPVRSTVKKASARS